MYAFAHCQLPWCLAMGKNDEWTVLCSVPHLKGFIHCSYLQLHFLWSCCNILSVCYTHCQLQWYLEKDELTVLCMRHLNGVRPLLIPAFNAIVVRLLLHKSVHAGAGPCLPAVLCSQENDHASRVFISYMAIVMASQ